MKIVRQKSPNGKKIYLYYDYGRAKGDRVKTGMFLYARPANAVEKQHNKQTADLLLVKQGQQVLEQQAIGTGYILFLSTYLRQTSLIITQTSSKIIRETITDTLPAASANLKRGSNDPGYLPLKSPMIFASGSEGICWIH